MGEVSNLPSRLLTTGALKTSCFKRFCYWIVALSLVALVAGVIFARPLLFVETKIRPAQVIIILGGGSKVRVGRALELLRAGSAPRVLLSGDDEQSSAMARLRKAKVLDTRIILESKSTSTKENAEFTVKILRAQKLTNVIVVTSWYHSRRALACFHRAAPEIHFQSAPPQPKLTPYGIPTARDAGFAAMEYLKMAWYALRWQIFPWDA